LEFYASGLRFIFSSIATRFKGNAGVPPVERGRLVREFEFKL
jgi:hypothetical protein